MAVAFDWVEPDHILSVTFSGRVDLADIQLASKHCLQHLRKSPLHFLMDFGAAHSLAAESLLHPVFTEWIRHPNSRWFAYVNLAGVYRALVHVRHRDSMRAFYDKMQAEAFLRRSLELMPISKRQA